MLTPLWISLMLVFFWFHFIFFSPFAAFLLAPPPTADVREPLRVGDDLHQELGARHHRRHRYDWAVLQKIDANPDDHVNLAGPFDTWLKFLMTFLNQLILMHRLVKKVKPRVSLSQWKRFFFLSLSFCLPHLLYICLCLQLLCLHWNDQSVDTLQISFLHLAGVISMDG